MPERLITHVRHVDLAVPDHEGDPDELSDDCAADGVYELLLGAAPMKVTGAVGAPVNPVAVK